MRSPEEFESHDECRHDSEGAQLQEVIGRLNGNNVGMSNVDIKQLS